MLIASDKYFTFLYFYICHHDNILSYSHYVTGKIRYSLIFAEFVNVRCICLLGHARPDIRPKANLSKIGHGRLKRLIHHFIFGFI